jgi:hypothetical protein
VNYIMPEFFENQIPEEAPVEPIVDEKIKVGEKEYSQADLQRLVGLGEIGVEAEQKFKTRIDSVWPKFQSVINEKKALEEKLAVFENEKQAQHAKELEDRMKQLEVGQKTTQTQTTEPAPQFTAEQIREIAIKQAEELGIGPQAMRKTVMEVIEGQKLLNDISGMIDEMTEDGLPSATTEDILTHMQETGIKNPGKAYKDMFEKEYLEKQAEKLASIKSNRTGLPTVAQSSAGAKAPPQSTNFRQMKDNDLTKLINDALQESFPQ